MFFETNYT